MNLILIKEINSLREFVNLNKQHGKTIGLVPTMGYLHAGHKKLMETAKQHCDVVIVSIFVNPLQFGVNEDLDSYPRNLEGDLQLCEKTGVNAVFFPSTETMYPLGKPHTFVNIQELDKNLCGASRPGHFTGVCTVVSKLFNIVTPNKAFFGKKDIQQLRIIETMTQELNFPVEIIGCDIVRAEDGLALSSRNSYLSSKEREQALIVPHVLNYLVAEIKKGETSVAFLIKKGEEFIQTHAPQVRLDYLQIVDYNHLQLISDIKGKTIIATAIFIGKTRLIDNILL